jgi:hypothetical protein
MGVLSEGYGDRAEQTVGEMFGWAWTVFTDMLALVNWTSPWTWLVIVAGFGLLAAANR